MGSSKKHKEKDREREHKHKKRRRSRSRSKDRRTRYDNDDRYHNNSSGRDDIDEKRSRYAEDSAAQGRGGTDNDYDHSRSVKQEVKKEIDEEPKSKSSGGEISMSIEETNKLRIKLGLRPLDVPNESSVKAEVEEAPASTSKDDVHAPPVNLSEVKKSNALKEKLEAIREKRKINQALGKVKTLGESDSEDDDMSSWVHKTRKLEKEKAMAEKRAKLLAEMDEEFGVSGLVNQEFKIGEKKSYSSKNLKGLKVQHAEDSFSEGKTVILTLKDKGILDEEEEPGDVLVNVNMVDNEKAKKNIENKKKKPDYVAYDEPEYDEYGQLIVKNLLDKYDEEIEGEAKKEFQLGRGGNYDADKEREMAKIRANLKNQAQTLTLPSLAIASEYYTQDEMSKFKKVKKKARKIRKKPGMLKAADLIPLSAGDDHGSRARGKHQQKETEEGELEENLPEDMDIDIPSLQPNDDGDISGPEGDLTNVAIEEDEAQLELQLALNKARKLKRRKEEAKPEKIAEKIVSSLQKESMDYSEAHSSNSAAIMLNATSEFCRSLGEIPTYGLAGNREEERDELLDYELELMQERRRKEIEEEDQKSGWLRVEVENKPVTITEGEDVAVLDEEPSLNEGIAGALLLAQKKGYIETDEKKAGTHKLAGKIQAQHYSIEDKKYDDIDEKYRHKQHRYGGGMLMDFKEKDSYRPDVKLEYIDDGGRKLNPKEAFKQLSYRFHGKGSGKKKTEKLMKKREEEQLMRMMSSTDTPLGTATLLQDKQRQEKTPYLVLSGGGVKTMTGGSTLTK